MGATSISDGVFSYSLLVSQDALEVMLVTHSHWYFWDFTDVTLVSEDSYWILYWSDICEDTDDHADQLEKSNSQRSEKEWWLVTFLPVAMFSFIQSKCCDVKETDICKNSTNKIHSLLPNTVFCRENPKN